MLKIIVDSAFDTLFINIIDWPTLRCITLSIESYAGSRVFMVVEA